MSREYDYIIDIFINVSQCNNYVTQVNYKVENSRRKINLCRLKRYGQSFN